ncbi:hypothetical protein Gogos_019716 [Gossypium gossypioides]|uniref:Uncharacterized protein n=1 Tax=Gossypium gossypioides TaxID=34282 RepID=A0A7J9BIH8_GOSGO|nr:hypothetical protein [Gossypium gossypioides]
MFTSFAWAQPLLGFGLSYGGFRHFRSIELTLIYHCSFPIPATQKEAIVDQMQQLIKEEKVFGTVTKMLNNVLNSCVEMLRLFTNQKLTNPLSIQGDLVQKEDEQLILYLPLPPDTGKGAEIHNNPEASPFLLDFPLPNYTSPSCDLDNVFWTYLNHNEIYYDLGEGSSDARANQDNMKLSQEKSSVVPGPADIQSIIMTSLAEVDHKIKSNPEMLELKDITDIEAKVQNIINKLAKAREMLEDQEEVKRPKEGIEKEERKKIEAGWDAEEATSYVIASFLYFN